MKPGKLAIVLSIAVLPLVFSGCGGYEEPEQGAIKRSPAPKPKPQAPAAKQEQVLSSELAGRQRNPFQSHLLTMKGKAARVKVKGPLECCELDLFRVQAMVDAGADSYALVLAPSGKRYLVKVGDVIGAREGRVTAIDFRGVTVREQVKTPDGTVLSSSDVVLGLPKARTKIKR